MNISMYENDVLVWLSQCKMKYNSFTVVITWTYHLYPALSTGLRRRDCPKYEFLVIAIKGDISVLHSSNDVDMGKIVESGFF